MTVASMTGYAVASGATPLGTVTLECRSVNSRFLDLTLRLNEDLRFADPLIRETIQKRIATSPRMKTPCPPASTLPS